MGHFESVTLIRAIVKAVFAFLRATAAYVCAITGSGAKKQVIPSLCANMSWRKERTFV